MRLLKNCLREAVAALILPVHCLSLDSWQAPLYAHFANLDHSPAPIVRALFGFLLEFSALWPLSLTCNY
jgi:hypothetical protein